MFKIFKKNSNKIKVEENSTFSKIVEAICLVNPEVTSDNVKLKTRLEHLGIDSIKFMNLLISFEDILGKDIEDFIDEIDVSKLETVDDIVLLIEKIK